MSLRRDDLSQDVAVALSRNPEFRAAVNEKFIAPRVAVLGRVLERARHRGEIGNGKPGRRLTGEAAASFVIGPLHHRVYVMGRPLSAAFQQGVVVAAVASLWPRPDRGRPPWMTPGSTNDVGGRSPSCAAACSSSRSTTRSSTSRSRR